MGGGFRISIRVRNSLVMLFILPIRFTGLNSQTITEPNQQDFMVLKISLIGFLSRFS